MKNNLLLFILLVLSIFTLSSCASNVESEKEKINIIPEQNIKYVNFEFGNVIQDGKQAVFFSFSSDYSVTKIEVVGILLDKNGDTVHAFDTAMQFGTPSKNPEMAIRIESGLIKYVKSVSFTKITAYTNEEVDSSMNEEKTSVLKLVATANSSTIDNYHASGSIISFINKKMYINLEKDETGCGFRWDLSEVDIKSNVTYVVKFEKFAVKEIRNKSIQLGLQWVDSTYMWPRYLNVKEKRFDKIVSGEISTDYYQFLTSKAYDEYSIEFELLHGGVDSSKTKTLYFEFWGVKDLLEIEKIALYEIVYE